MTSHRPEAPAEGNPVGSSRAEPNDTGTTALIADLARAVDEVPGVTRREPNVGDFLRTLWKKPVTGDQGSPDTKGMRLDVEEEIASLTVAVWVAGSTPGTALAIAQEVTSRINRTITEHGFKPGKHQVSVREVE
ncbi:hypothetical protein [Rothia uropygialis]|uniref:hypothetical protein n=1 Tax=Kocuria sp. 36 TaxID=1415402 RepID=UPI00101E0DA5|nr:hypothetical protein [Kocuria sp. 36]